MHEETEYDPERVTEAFLKEFRQRERRTNYRYLLAGLVGGILLSAGSAYAVYYAEMAYESHFNFAAPSIGDSPLPITMDSPEWHRPPMGHGPRFNDRLGRRNEMRGIRPVEPQPPMVEAESE